MIVELGALEWQRSDDGDTRTTDFAIGSAVVRTGITEHAEVELGWSPFVRQTSLTRTTRQTEARSSTGDVEIAIKQALGAPEGPAAIRAFVTIPTSDVMHRAAIGGGVMLPLEFELTPKLTLAMTPEIDLLPDEAQAGRHARYGGVVGLDLKLADAVGIGADFASFRDDDPDARTTARTLGAALAWQVADDTQLDVGGLVGIDSLDPSIGFYFGIARRF